MRSKAVTRHRLSCYAGSFDALSGQPRAYLAVGTLIKLNHVWAFKATFADFKGKL